MTYDYQPAVLRAIRYRDGAGAIEAFRALTGVNPYAFRVKASIRLVEESSKRRVFFHCAFCGEQTQERFPYLCGLPSCTIKFNQLLPFQQSDYLRILYPRALWLTLLDFSQVLPYGNP